MNNIKYILFAVLTFALTLPLSGCNFAILDPKGIIAASEMHLLVLSVLLMLLIVVPVIIMSFVFAWRYRASNTNTKYMPDWGHNTAIEVVCWSVPCVIILTLAIITWISSHQLDPYKPLASNEKPLTIEAIALDWKWLFIYPDQNIATINFVQIPAHVPVQFLITSDAPMNSLEIPQLAGQIYAMAGMQTKLNLMANEIGDYSGLSTNYSGNGFAGMGFIVRASSKDQFDQWVSTVQRSPENLTANTYNQLVQPSENNKVEYFASINNSLFENVVMKGMMPMPDMNTMQTASNSTSVIQSSGNKM